MIRISTIQELLLPLIGWRPDYDVTGETIISKTLATSETGLYYQDIHPLLTLRNLQSIAPDIKNSDYANEAWIPNREYKKGNLLSYDSKLYKALEDTRIMPPSSEWEQTSAFSEWLEAKTKASIIKAVNRFINEKTVDNAYKVLCENKTLFDGTGRIYDTIPNKNNLVGFEIVPIRSKGVTTKINKIGLQFTKAGNYTIYVMHSSNQDVYYKETFTKNKDNSMEWFIPSEDLFLPYLGGTDLDVGGSWYIFYIQNDLPDSSQAIRKNRDWSKGPCSQCSRYEYASWAVWSKYIEIHPFYVNSELVPSDPQFDDDDNYTGYKYQLWDIEDNQYTYDTNYGINLDISVMCDITDFIMSQRNLFQDYLGKSVAVDLLREFAYNPNVRTNRNSINAARPDILYELDGDSSSLKKSGLNYQLELSLKALSISTEGIDRVCMPCSNHGIKYRAV